MKNPVLTARVATKQSRKGSKDREARSCCRGGRAVARRSAVRNRAINDESASRAARVGSAILTLCCLARGHLCLDLLCTIPEQAGMPAFAGDDVAPRHPLAFPLAEALLDPSLLISLNSFSVTG